MNYKETKFLTNSLFSLTEQDFSASLQQKCKVSFDGQTEITYKPLSSDLQEIINFVINRTDLKNSLTQLVSFCSMIDCRPDPNELLYFPDFFSSICNLIFYSNDDEMIFLDILNILIHLSLADFNENCPFLSFDFLSHLLNHEYLGQNYLPLILELILNISYDPKFSFLNSTMLIELNIAPTLTEVCLASNSSKDLSISFQIITNIAKTVIETEFLGNLSVFDVLLPSLISSLKPNFSQGFAVECISYLFNNEKSCFESLKYNIYELLKKSLESLREENISDVYICFNFLIQHTHKIDEFIDNSLVTLTLNIISKVLLFDFRPLFLFFDLLLDNYQHKFLNSCGVGTFLLEMIPNFPLKVKKMAVFVLSHMVDLFWPNRADRPDWTPYALALIAENVCGLSVRKAERVLAVIVEAFQCDSCSFMAAVSADCLIEAIEEINEFNEAEGSSATIRGYADFLYRAVMGNERCDDDV